MSDYAYVIMERIGGLFVFGQAIIFAPSIWRLFKDKEVRGVSIPTIAFYAFASAWYLPLYWHWQLPTTFWGLVAVFAVETIWVIYAIYLTWVNPKSRSSPDAGAK